MSVAILAQGVLAQEAPLTRCPSCLLCLEGPPPSLSLSRARRLCLHSPRLPPELTLGPTWALLTLGAMGHGGKGTKGGKTFPRDLKFIGCWHCGEKGHSRQTCDQYIEFVGGLKPDGKPKPPPPNYKGAYEKWVDSGKPKQTNAIYGDGGDDDSEDFEGA